MRRLRFGKFLQAVPTSKRKKLIVNKGTMRAKLLLAGTIALLASSARADVALSPTDPLIGNWCEIKGSTTLLKRGPSCDTVISKDGYGGVETSCTFLEIKRIPGGIEAFLKCSAESLNEPLWYERTKFQIVRNRLKIELVKEYKFKLKQIDTGDTHDHECVEVQPTPDGFLNLRQGPGMNFKVIAKLLSYQRISVDKRTDKWTHVRAGCGDDAADEGWVYNEYISDIKTVGDCPNEGLNGACEPDGDSGHLTKAPPLDAPPPPLQTYSPEPKYDYPKCD
jgi:hypothetical protein